jgi:thiol-disulfide isomerase/thioredoxin
MSNVGAEFEALLGSTLIGPSGENLKTREALANKTSVGLYFSASWCPPCRAFTPVLSEKYRTAYRAKGMEIVFVTSDRDERSFREYHSHMPWLAVPFDNFQVRQSLGGKFGVRGIPMLVVIDAQKPGLTVITSDGRQDVMTDQTGSRYFGITVAPKFPGQGQSVGGASAVPATSASHVDVASGLVHLDRTKPITTIQVRFPDGKKVSQDFNSSAKCTEVLSFVSKVLGPTGGKRIKLTAGFPPAEIEDLGVTVTAAGIANAAVTVQLA